MYDAIIVGGGLAGLSAAHRLRHRNVLLLEKEPRFGGRIRSERRGDYWLNWGAHVYNGPGTATGDLMSSVGIDSTPVPGSLAGLAMNGTLLTSGRVETYPFRVPMSWSDRAALLRAGVKVRMAVMKYAKVSAPRDGEDYRVRQQRIYDFLGDRTFSDFVGDLPNDADALFRPTVSRSAGDPEQVSAGAGVGYFHLVWDRSGGLCRNIVGGPSTLTETIGAGLGASARIGAEVTEVIHGKNHVIVRYRHDGKDHEAKARYAVLATTAPVTSKIAPDLEADVRDALSKIVYGPYVSAAFLTNETTPQRWDSSYAIATPKRAFNVFFNMSNTTRAAEPFRGKGSSIMAFSPARFARPSSTAATRRSSTPTTRTSTTSSPDSRDWSTRPSCSGGRTAWRTASPAAASCSPPSPGAAAGSCSPATSSEPGTPRRPCSPDSLPPKTFSAHSPPRAPCDPSKHP
jgi:oxygen-dependent protoporphyrinogen oxidase